MTITVLLAITRRLAHQVQTKLVPSIDQVVTRYAKRRSSSSCLPSAMKAANTSSPKDYVTVSRVKICVPRKRFFFFVHHGHDKPAVSYSRRGRQNGFGSLMIFSSLNVVDPQNGGRRARDAALIKKRNPDGWMRTYRTQ